jgi:hypothetical protein
MRRSIVALLVAVALSLSLVGPAAAQQQQDGLVNVAVGDITVQDVNVGVAATIVATVCGIKVGPVAVLAVQVDQSGEPAEIACPAQGGDAVITQN